MDVGLLFCIFVKPSANVFWVGSAVHKYFARISCLLHVSKAWQMQGDERYCFCLAFVAYFSLLPLWFFFLLWVVLRLHQHMHVK